jgi:hypothetical protein
VVEDVSTAAVDVVATVSVAAVLEDLVALLQPLSANPARIKVNNIEFFIGGLIALRLTAEASIGSGLIRELIMQNALSPPRHVSRYRSARFRCACTEP